MDRQSRAYIDEMARLLAYLRHRRFRHLWDSPAHPKEWHGRPQVMQSLAFQHAVLHHVTGRPEHLHLATQHLMDFDQGYHFGSLFTAKAYELIQPALSASQRRTFAQAWVAGARTQLDRFVLPSDGSADPRVIAGWNQLNNHQLCAAVYADLARRLFPETSRPYRFERVTDALWKMWWARRDFAEQASNYEGFSMCFLCAWADLRGVSEAFYASPTLRAMFDRSARVVSPSGIVAPYADSGPNAHATAWIALFEKGAAHTGRGEWRGLARDAFAYLRRRHLLRAAEVLKRVADENTYNGRCMYGLFLHPLSWLGMAALWSDPDLKPTPRTTVSGINARPPVGYVLTRADRCRLPEHKLVPCQVAMVGGPRTPAKQTYMLLSVGPKYPHDHADAGSILLLSRGDTVLLGTNGYLQRELPYHHTFIVQPADPARFPDDHPDRITMGDPHCAGTIEHYQADECTSACRVRFAPYHGQPVVLTREFIIDAQGHVLIVDRVVAKADGLCAGPVFHAEVLRKVGRRTYDLRLDTLRTMNGMEVRNAPGALRVTCTCPDAEVRTVSLRTPAVYTRQPSYRVFPCNQYVQVWRRSYTARRCLALRHPLAKDRETLFVTRLVPTP